VLRPGEAEQEDSYFPWCGGSKEEEERRRKRKRPRKRTTMERGEHKCPHKPNQD
jgi:hypothetical protein